VQADRLFLVGRSPRGVSENDWSAGRIYAVAWDRLSHYVLFDSLKAYRERGRKSPAGTRKTARKAR